MNPEDLGSVRSGEFVAQHITPLDEDESLDEEAIQPNGVDLSIGKLYRLDGNARLRNDGYEKPDRVPVSTEEYNGVEYHQVDQRNAYIIKYAEKIHIPESHIGLVLPRSRLMRCGLGVDTAVWDAGYEGVGEGQLVANQPASLEAGMRVAQIVFARTEPLEESYDGSHQGEGL